jgi:abortive infection bacteriophage resistance protein
MVDDFEEKVPYRKKPLSVKMQIAKLKGRGLIVDDENLTSEYLLNISYYRLRAYTYPFQNNTPGADHEFIRKDIHFKDVIDLYCFDRRLRSLIFNAIEKIEVSIRTKIIQIYGESTSDSHWFENETLFKDDSKQIDGEEIFAYNTLSDDILREVNRSNKDFIKHYKSKYSVPEAPPAWMALEVVSLGTLSHLYELLKKDDNKKTVAKYFGLNKIDILENWMHALSTLRNCCAHHGRIWNRRFTVGVLFPTNTDRLFLDRDTIAKTRQNKLFAYLCCIKYILDIISPNNDFHKNLKDLIANGGNLLSLKEMGFPNNWNYLGVWKG